MSYTNVNHLGTSQNDWKRSLEFYVQDIAILDKRLVEIAGKNTGPEAAEGIEHFQNQFDIQRQNISNLNHRILANNQQAAIDVKQHAGHINEEVLDNKETIGDDMQSFEKRMNELRHEFNSFLSKWM
jgi:septation ring formation regulator EzrA